METKYLNIIGGLALFFMVIVMLGMSEVGKENYEQGQRDAEQRIIQEIQKNKHAPGPVKIGDDTLLIRYYSIK